MSEETGPYQTQLLLVSIRHNKEVAETILSREVFQYYDRAQVARACEQAGMWTRALSLASDWDAVLDTLEHIPEQAEMDDEATAVWLTQKAPATIPELTQPANILQVLAVLARACPTAAVRSSTILVTQQRVNLDDAVALFGSTDAVSVAKLPEGQRRALFQLISPLLHLVKTPATAKVFIEVAVSLDCFSDVERAIRECSRVYDPAQIFEVLADAPRTAQNPLALVILADMHGMIKQMIEFFLRR